MEIYFDKLVTILLAYLNINDRILPEPIFKQIFSLKNSEDHYILLCKKVNTHYNQQFQYRLIENLVTVLVSEHSLENLRINLAS